MNLFGEIINNALILNIAGKMVEEKLQNISDSNGISVDKYIVMPDHIHAIIFIMHDGTTQGSFPTLSEKIQRFKTLTTKIYIDGVKKGFYLPFNKKLWQKSFNDKIIRNESTYSKVCQYTQ